MEGLERARKEGRIGGRIQIYDHDKIMKLRKNGNSYSKISKIVGCSKTLVALITKKNKAP
jgi:DNA invertase Pin-like site-specific DNA recombinase